MPTAIVRASPRQARVGAWLALAALGLVVATETFATGTRIAGTDLLGEEFAPAVVAAGREHDWPVQVELAGTRPALQQLRSGAADIALLALPPGELPPGDEFFSREIAAQPIVVVVPESVPLTQITHAQVRGVFAIGAAENFSTWGDLGLTGDWRTRAITAFVPAPQAGLTVPLARRLGFNGGELKPSVVALASAAELPVRLVAAGSGVGLTSTVPAAGSGLRALALAASVTDAAHQPTAENLQRAAYAWRLPLYLTVRRAAVPRLLPLLRVLLDEDCRNALAAADFVPLPAAARDQLLLELEHVR